MINGEEGQAVRREFEQLIAKSIKSLLDFTDPVSIAHDDWFRDYTIDDLDIFVERIRTITYCWVLIEAGIRERTSELLAEAHDDFVQTVCTTVKKINSQVAKKGRK